MKFRCLFFLCFSVLTCCQLWAQEEEINRRITSLQFVSTLPEGLLSNKTVVLLKHQGNSNTPKWAPIAEILQKGFKKAGIDAVAYYDFDDILSGYESYQAFLDAFDDRDLTYAALLITDGQFYRLAILKLQDRDFLLKENQEAWKIDGKDLNKMMEDLYRQAANSGQEKNNLLIIEIPEFGEKVKTIKGRRSEFYDLNFSSEKLAVPQFTDSASIAKVMESYPYSWELVPLGSDEKELRTKGFQYILYYNHAAQESVRQILEYPISQAETAYVSEVIIDKQSKITAIPANDHVYKFYVKHIYSQNVFVGKRWDAAKTWQEALHNYIANLRNELIRN